MQTLEGILVSLQDAILGLQGPAQKVCNKGSRRRFLGGASGGFVRVAGRLSEAQAGFAKFARAFE